MFHTFNKAFRWNKAKCFVPSPQDEKNLNDSYPQQKMYISKIIFHAPTSKNSEMFLNPKDKKPWNVSCPVLLFIINFLSSLINCRKICQLHRRGSCAFIRREFPDLRLEWYYFPDIFCPEYQVWYTLFRPYQVQNDTRVPRNQYTQYLGHSCANMTPFTKILAFNWSLNNWFLDIEVIDKICATDWPIGIRVNIAENPV